MEASLLSCYREFRMLAHSYGLINQFAVKSELLIFQKHTHLALYIWASHDNTVVKSQTVKGLKFEL